MRQLSFVFQGKVYFDNDCSEVIENIRRVRVIYPSSEIILSTWSVSLQKEYDLLKKLKDLDVKIIFSADPGPLVYRDKSCEWTSNINRMILSSKNGIECSTRDYVIKLRTDSYFKNDNLRKIFSKRDMINKRYNRDVLYSLFTERIINCNLFARHSRSYRPFDYHPGDIMMLGKKEDVLNFFCSPLADESLFEVIFNKYLFSLMNLVPEQYLWVNYIKSRVCHFDYIGNKYRGTDITASSEKYYMNNFIPFSCAQLGFVWPKYFYKYKNRGVNSVYQYSDWLLINKKLYKNNPDKIYGYKFTCRVIFFKIVYFFFYLPLRWGSVRRIIMHLKSRG